MQISKSLTPCVTSSEFIQQSWKEFSVFVRRDGLRPDKEKEPLFQKGLSQPSKKRGEK
jgi:hypothetical protein